MAHDNGHDPQEAAPSSGHGGEHGHEGPAGVPPESSLQDKFLQILAAVALVALLVAGFQWSQTKPPESPAPHGEGM